MKNELDGKVALVTGASQGLGRRFARTLADAGATLVVASRNTDALDELAGEIGALRGTAHVVRLDVTDVSSIETAIAEAIERAGAIDILVNNAGLAVNALIRDTTPDEFDVVMNTNVRGAYFVAKQAGVHMQERGQGKIVNLSSVLSEFVMPGVSAYCMSKAAISTMTKAMALEFARGNVQVNALAPGFVHTDINAAFFATPRGQEIMGRFPGGALQQPEHLDSSLLFLASSASDHLTGITLHVDDGQSLGAFQAARK